MMQFIEKHSRFYLAIFAITLVWFLYTMQKFKVLKNANPSQALFKPILIIVLSFIWYFYYVQPNDEQVSSFWFSYFFAPKSAVIFILSYASLFLIWLDPYQVFCNHLRFINFTKSDISKVYGGVSILIGLKYQIDFYGAYGFDYNKLFHDINQQYVVTPYFIYDYFLYIAYLIVFFSEQIHFNGIFDKNFFNSVGFYFD
jgi:hypothetical protein